MKLFQLLTQVVIFAITACCISACAGDPRAVLLEPYVETNPPPNAIVGLWNSKYSTYSTTILFRKNGTGLYSWNKDANPISFTYEYGAKGEWKTSLHGGIVFKIAKGQLMLYMWPCKPQIFDRKA